LANLPKVDVPDRLEIVNGITGAIDVIGIILNVFGFHVVCALTNNDHAALSLITQAGMRPWRIRT
jgi:hypothetical protein